jgi:hypothetical protein
VRGAGGSEKKRERWPNTRYAEDFYYTIAERSNLVRILCLFSSGVLTCFLLSLQHIFTVSVLRSTAIVSKTNSATLKASVEGGVVRHNNLVYHRLFFYTSSTTEVVVGVCVRVPENIQTTTTLLNHHCRRSHHHDFQ